MTVKLLKTGDNLPVMILEAELKMPLLLSFAAGCGGGGRLGRGLGLGGGLEGRGRDPEWYEDSGLESDPS